MGLVTAKNFVLANAVETMLAPARKPPPPPPPATAKADFGKVPSYLGGVKARLAAEKAAEEERKLEEVRIVHCRAAREARLAPAALRHGSGLIHRSIHPPPRPRSYNALTARPQAAAAEAASGLRELSAEERAELLERLGAKWETLNSAYCRLPLVCDTDPKKRRKEVFEAELKQLELDMESLARPGPVLVANS